MKPTRMNSHSALRESLTKLPVVKAGVVMSNIKAVYEYPKNIQKGNQVDIVV